MPKAGPALTPSEVRLARWLQGRMGFGGARTFVARRGAPMILAALRDGLMEVDEGPPAVDYDALVAWRTGGCKGALPGSSAVRRRRFNPEIERPAGFLRWLVDQLVREAR